MLLECIYFFILFVGGPNSTASTSHIGNECTESMTHSRDKSNLTEYDELDSDNTDDDPTYKQPHDSSKESTEDEGMFD